MFRVGVVALCFYTWGAPAFDGYRPQPLDRAVKNFHADINHMSRDFTRTVDRMSRSAPVQFVGSYRNATETFVAARAAER